MSNSTLSLARPANVGTIAYLIALNGPAFAFLFGATGLIAFSDRLHAFGIVALLLAGLNMAAYVLVRRGAAPTTVSRAEAIMSVALLFTLASVMAAAPLVAYGLGPSAAVFEATSGVTTTGLTILTDVERAPFTIVFFRAALQWFGGGLFLITAIALVLSPGRLASRLGAAEFDERGLLASSRARARTVLSAYLALTLITVLALMAATGSPTEAILHGFAAVSTGGFSFANDSLASQSAMANAIVITASLAGAVSLSAYVLLAGGKWRAFFGAREFIALVLCTLLTACAISLFEWQAGAAPLPALMGTGLVLAGSAQSTAGFSNMPIADLQPASQMTLILSMMIGGDAGSTAGGLKIIRILLVGAIIRLVLIRILMPDQAVVKPRVGSRTIPEREMAGVTALIAIFVGLQLLATIILTAAGYPPMAALFDVTSALSTVGLSVGVSGPSLSDPLKLLLSFLMLAGRVEIIGLAIVLLPSAWRNT